MKQDIGLSWIISCMNWGSGGGVRSSYENVWSYEGGLQPTGNAMWVLCSISLWCVHNHFWAQMDELFYLRHPTRVLLCQMLPGLLTSIAWMLFWLWKYMLCDHLHKSWKPTRFLGGIKSLIPFTFPIKLKPISLTSSVDSPHCET